MAWGTIRKATSEDFEALDKAARRFADRHDIEIDLAGTTESIYKQVDRRVENELGMHRDPNDQDHIDALYLSRLWKRCVRRALHEPNADGISWDYVGYEAQ